MGIAEFCDRLVSVFSPTAALHRAVARESLRSLVSGEITQNTKYVRNVAEPVGPIDISEIERSRNNAWDIHQNSPTARKAIRSIVSKVWGCGPIPESLTEKNGEPYTEFRENIQRLFIDWCNKCDIKGLPGYGGMGWCKFGSAVLREMLVGGECFVRFIISSSEESKKRNLPGRLLLESFGSERISEYWEVTNSKNEVYRGIEYGENNKRKFYHVLTNPPNSGRLKENYVTIPVSANDVIHLFLPDRMEQVRGVTCLNSVINTIRDADQLQENEVRSSTVASLFAVVIKKLGGLNVPSNTNGKTRPNDLGLPPGIVQRLDPGEDLHPVNPQRSHNESIDFLDGLRRVVSTGLPGVKSSSVTGDYRRSSYSSERTSDNDTWPEIEQIQQDVIDDFLNPIYFRFVENVISLGLIKGVSLEDFRADPSNFTRAEWPMPVRRLINPKDEIEASKLAIDSYLSSHVIETSRSGRNFRKVIKDHQEFNKEIKKSSLGEKVIGNEG